MPLTERERHDAYEALQRTFGDTTDVVIQLLRPDHEKLATKDDLALTTATLRGEMAHLRTEMADLRTELKTEMADLRIGMGDLRTELKIDMGDLRTELKIDMADLRTDLRTDMATLRVDLTSELHTAFAAQTRTLVIGLISAVLLIAVTNALTVLVG